MHRLITRGAEIDDGQPGMTQPNRILRIDKIILTVRTPVPDRSRHIQQNGRINVRSFPADYSTDSTHSKISDSRNQAKFNRPVLPLPAADNSRVEKGSIPFFPWAPGSL